MKTRAGKVLLTIMWYCAAAAAALFYSVQLLLPAYDAMDAKNVSSVLSFSGVAVGLIAIVAAFFFCHSVARLWWRSGTSFLQVAVPAQEAQKSQPVAGSPSAFPAPITLLVGGFVLLFGIANIAGFAVTWFLPPDDNRTLLLTTLAAGLGSFVATMLGYLLHASERKDFDTAYSAWYVGRPFIGLILGVIFYFLFKGGLLLVTAGGADLPLSDPAMAAIGSLVGLFSKNAVEKLREVFNTLFQTKDGMSTEILASLPPELREKVAAYLKPGQKPAEPTQKDADGGRQGGVQ